MGFAITPPSALLAVRTKQPFPAARLQKRRRGRGLRDLAVRGAPRVAGQDAARPQPRGVGDLRGFTLRPSGLLLLHQPL